MRRSVPIAPFIAVLALSAMLAPRGAGAFTMPPECANLSLAEFDTDGDGLDDRYESCVVFTDHLKADTDGDGMNDFDELIRGRSPRFADKRLIDVDSDSDYLNDDWELKLGTGLMNPDTDGDMFLDGTEVAASFHPTDPTEGAMMEKLIEIDDKGLKLTYSMGGTVLGVIPISSGKPSTPTPHGEFAVTDKIPVKPYIGPGYHYPNTWWNLRFATSARGLGYYIHGAYWHNNFGRWPVSGGCVNVRYEDMEHLYWWAQHGTKIIIQ